MTIIRPVLPPVAVNAAVTPVHINRSADQIRFSAGPLTSIVTVHALDPASSSPRSSNAAETPVRINRSRPLMTRLESLITRPESGDWLDLFRTQRQRDRRLAIQALESESILRFNQIKARMDARGEVLDLKGKRFYGLDWRGVDLRGVNLKRARLTAMTLSDAQMNQANLSGATLRRANLSRANLSHANLHKANLIYANLLRTNLSVAKLTDADLSHVQLHHSTLYAANLWGANLRWAILHAADLSNADLNGANLQGADLSNANLSGAILYQANLAGTNLNGANLVDANTTGADLSRLQDFNPMSLDERRDSGNELMPPALGPQAAAWQEAVNYRIQNLLAVHDALDIDAQQRVNPFRNPSGTQSIADSARERPDPSLPSAKDALEAIGAGDKDRYKEIKQAYDKANQTLNLARANLSDLNLKGINLRNVRLEDASLNDADLSHADLRGAILDGASLLDTRLSAADLSGARMVQVDCMNANFENANLKGAQLLAPSTDSIGCNLAEANFKHADLTDAKFKNAELIGAHFENAKLSSGTQFNGCKHPPVSLTQLLAQQPCNAIWHVDFG